MKRTLLVLALLLLPGCAGGGGSGTSLEQGPTVVGFEFTDLSAVAEGAALDGKYTCDGGNGSPTIGWRGVPDGAKELALVLEDPDAPGGTFTHWLVYRIKPNAFVVLPDTRYDGEGKNDFGDVGYGGPCPPEGEEHHYVFRLLALDAPSGLEGGVDRAAFDDAVAPHVIAEARLITTYARP